MQLIPFKLSHHTFFCPITGEQLLSSDDYHSSPATLFHFSTKECGHLIASTPKIENGYLEALEQIKSGLYKDYSFTMGITDEIKAFEVLVNEKLRQEDHYVLFSLTNDSDSCEPLSNTVYIGIDKNYNKVADIAEKKAFDFECWFPNFENYEDILLKGTQINPSYEGYALFMEDTMGCGGFYFINTEEEWEMLLPALVFLDYVNQDWQTIAPDALNRILKVYFDYFNAGIYDKLPEHFTPDLNKLLEDYKIVFFGKTIELLEPNSEFTTELLEAFGSNPNESKENFTRFLTEYYKI